MIFRETPLPGAFIIDLEPIVDERGFFARSWCREEFSANGIEGGFVQLNISYNRRRGTLRGLHYQAEPHAETKLLRVTRGSVFDVLVDIRETSTGFRRWFAVELSAENRRMLYIPKGMAHGFQTLEDDTEVLYQMGEYYVPEAARGIRWDDPELAIAWPIPDPIVSERDSDLPGIAALIDG